MRKLFVLFAALGLLLVLSGCEADPEQSKMEYYTNADNQEAYVLENDALLLEVDGFTGYFTLTDKSSDAVWTSVPEKGAEDPLADTETKNRMRSTLLLSYTDDTGNVFTYNNYQYSLAGGTYRITQEQDTIILNYMVGPAERFFVLPEAISEARMQTVLDGLEAEDRTFLLKNYRRLDLSKIKDEKRKQELLGFLPQLEHEVMYALSTATGGNPLKDYQMERIEEIFASVGYTEEQAKADQVNTETTQKAIQFNVTMRLRLDADSLVVEVPMQELRYPKAYPITQIRVLPYLCSAGDGDTGYLLVPDGGGGQIFFHNGKTKANPYLVDIYGFDEAFARDIRVQETSAAYPVFGIARNGSYLLAVAEGAAAEMQVEADVAGKNSSYDYVCPIFKAVHGERTSISQKTESSIFVSQSEKPTECIRLRYFAGESDSYVDMAVRYREYVKMKYPRFSTKTAETGTPLIVEFIGVIDRNEKVLGIPVKKSYAAVQYTEAMAVVEDLTDIENLRIRYSAVFNGGMDQKQLTKLKAEPQLGTQAERDAFLAAVRQAQVKLYLGGYAEQVMQRSSLLSASDTIRSTMNTVVERYPFSQNTQAVSKNREDRIYLLNRDAVVKSIHELSKTAGQWGCAGIALNDVGRLLYSDFNTGGNVSRDAMQRAQAQALESVGEQGMEILIDGGFEYALANADCVCAMDLQGARYDIIDRQIPFYQIALHGYVSYTGRPLNQAGNYLRAVLNSVETGAGFSFTFMESDYQELQGNKYTYQHSLYGANYADWKEALHSLYARVNSELGHINNQTIVDHSYLSDTVTCTRYADGTAVYVNYGCEDWSFEGVTIPAEDWITVKGG